MEDEDKGGTYVPPDIVLAAYEGDHATVSSLLKAGVSVNSLDERDNLTLLHIGCLNGDDRLVDILLAHHAEHGDLDFTIRSKHRPRLAWQFAMNAHQYQLSRKVDEAGRPKEAAKLEQALKP